MLLAFSDWLSNAVKKWRKKSFFTTFLGFAFAARFSLNDHSFSEKKSFGDMGK